MAADLAVDLPLWAVAAVLVLPALDMLHSFTAWSNRLWTDHDHRAWQRFWSVSAGLRWLQAGLATAVLVVHGVPLSAVGVRFPATPILAASALLGLAAVVVYAVVAARTPSVPVAAAPTDYTTTFPTNARERALWLVAGGVTAGVCEEFLYRGVALAGLLGLGFGWPVAVAVAALSFAASHGLAVLNPFAVAMYVAFALVQSGVVLYTGSLLPAIALHGAWNLLEVARTLADEGSEAADAAAT